MANKAETEDRWLLSGTTLKIFIILSFLGIIIENYYVYTSGMGAFFKYLVGAGVFFDLALLTIFIVRFIIFFVRKECSAFMIHGTGWIELISSALPLLLVSIPYMCIEFFYDGINGSSAGVFFHISGVAANLRLLRIVPLFNTGNVIPIMLRKHLIKIKTLIAAGGVIALMLASLWGIVVLDGTVKKHAVYIADLVAKQPQMMTDIIKKGKSIVMIEKSGKVIFSSPQIKRADMKKELLAGNIFSITNDEKIKVYFTNSVILGSRAVTNSINFIIILLMIWCVSGIYSGYFRKYVIHPLNVMTNQFQSYDYILATRIPEGHERDELFVLASLVNDRWLPAKMKKISDNGLNRKSLLQINDVFKEQD